MLPYKRTGYVLLNVLLIFFFNHAHSQIYISEGTTVYIENSTVVTHNLKSAVSKSLNISKSSENKRSGSDRKKAYKKAFSLVLLKLTKEKVKSRHKSDELEIYSKRNKLISLYHHCNNKDNSQFTPSDSAKKPTILPDRHLNWAPSPQVFLFAPIYCYTKERIYYKSQYLHSLNNKSFRIRPPPSLS